MLQPLGPRVVIEKRKAEEKIGSIIVPDNAKEKPRMGTILAVGTPDADKEDMKELKVGDTVLFSQYAGTDVQYDGQELTVISMDELLAVERK